MKQIKTTSVIQRDPDMLFSRMDNEVVMLSIPNSEYYGLDEIGSYIWDALEKPKKVEEIIHQLVQKYEVSHEQCEADVMPLLRQLYEKKLIHLVHE